MYDDIIINNKEIIYVMYKNNKKMIDNKYIIKYS